MQHHPIFVNGFSRGGTTILMNLLASHPDVCTIGEIHQIFKGSSVRDSAWQTLWKSATRDLPVILRSREDVFSPRNWRPRRPLSSHSCRFVRRTLEAALCDSQHAHLNRYREPQVRYRLDEICQSRMLGKMLDGMVHLTDTMRAIYPNASFVGLVRNGFAFCEGHVRRGRSAADAGRLYQQIVDKMLTDSQRIENYTIVRFEQLIFDPMQQLRRLFCGLDLDPTEVKFVRMQERRRMNDEGEHQLHGSEEWQIRWLPVTHVSQFLDANIDARQIRLLSRSDQAEFLAHAGPSMERLNYIDSAVPADYAAIV